MRRIFVAVPLAEDVRSQVAGLVERVRLRPEARGPGGGPERRDPLDVRWVRMDGLHLTLRFLGPVLEDRIPAVEAAIHEAAGSGDPFEIRIDGAGGFPSAARPRALWLGVTDGAEALQRLARRLDDALAGGGWPIAERPFRAHLTLARADGVKSGPDAARRLMAAADGFSATWQADRLVLFESHTGAGPARYEPLAEASLGRDQ